MTEERQKELWDNCVFVFDTSALLALYLYPEGTRQQIYREIFEKIKDRLWIPHHVYYEFLKNKESKIREPISRSYIPLKNDYIKPIVDTFHKSLNRIDTLKNAIRNSNTHPYMVSEELELYEAKLKKFIDTTVEFEKVFSGQMEEKVQEILQLEKQDTVYQNIQQYFRVGREYSYDEILKITVEGKHRYEFKIPPGYEDLKDKIGTQIFGDLIIWKQILEYAKESRKNIVFICNDVKEDWWHLIGDKKSETKKRPHGPRRELVKEFKDHTGGAFWMYNQARFLEMANTLIHSNVSSRQIEQVSAYNTSVTTEKLLLFACNTCGQEDTLNTTSLQLDNNSIAAIKENKQLVSKEFHCKKCNTTLGALFEVGTSPLGEAFHELVIFKGATLIHESPVESDSFFEDAIDETLQEETILLHKKQLRLKANKARKVALQKTVNGIDTLFTVNYTKAQDADTATRLQVEAYNSTKNKLSRTLVLEKGTTRFVLQTQEEDMDADFSAVYLTADRDLTIYLSVVEFPGTGNYIEKLYY